ncbi:dynamin family protein [Actinomycetospora endophytica]|uniref:Dynamin family protein n=1 Tax=Actinomycetospora endophytica TaxID=2291215 RepID=A0ABS8PDK8_9PSEU|nr:dynamin family protein [Actinomycetospora endophytica]MCD2196364.1 dynamin family protein [Actinomycetospora endophytica]
MQMGAGDSRLAADREEARAVTALAVRAATAYGRPDIAATLDLAHDRLADTGARVLVVGDFKQGKSALVGELVGVPVCPVHDDVATRLPTVVRHAETTTATLVGTDADGAEIRRPITSADLTRAVTGGADDDGEAWTAAEVTVPGGLAADGLVLVDTPGEGGPRSARGLAVRAGFPEADAAVVVSDASRELTAPEIALVRAATEQCATVVVALSKVDLHPRWREVRDLDRHHLAAHGLDVDVLPVSATLASHARRLAERAEPAADAVARESGVPALAARLRERVGDPAGARLAVGVLDQVAGAVAELGAALEAERVGLEDPERAREVAADLTAARDRAAELKERSARWQQTLADGVSDLVSDIDWDLRDRMRHVVRAAEEALDAADPGASWDTFAPWLTEEVGEAVATTFVWAGERTWRLSERVAEHFALSGDDVRGRLPGGAGGALVHAGVCDESRVEQTMPGGMLVRAELPDVPGIDVPDLERIGFANGVVVGMRGSYGGVLMVGMVTTLSGLALINPFSIGAGVLLGSKTIRDERKRALQRRRAEAKQAVRRHAEEVLHLAGKRSRDLLRDVQRLLRDHFTGQAETLARSVAEAVTAAAAAQEIATGSQERRLRDVRAELGRVDLLAERVAACRAGFGTSDLSEGHLRSNRSSGGHLRSEPGHPAGSGEGRPRPDRSSEGPPRSEPGRTYAATAAP